MGIPKEARVLLTMTFNISNLDLIEYVVKVLGYLETKKDKHPYINVDWFCSCELVAAKLKRVTVQEHVDTLDRFSFGYCIPMQPLSEEAKADAKTFLFSDIVSRCVLYFMEREDEAIKIAQDAKSARTFKQAIDRLLEIADAKVLEQNQD